MTGKPLLLVDVDGVISLFGFEPDKRPDGTWHQIDGMAHLFSAEAGRHLQILLTDFDLVWCTGWEERADEHLPGLLGLPRLPWLSFDRNPGRGNTHWKLTAIDGYALDRPLAWLDDALDARCEEWARTRSRRGAPTLLMHTLPAVGLTARERDALRAWAAGLPTDGDVSPANR
jgi:hypothetical protein